MRRLHLVFALFLLIVLPACSSGSRPQSRLLQSVMVSPGQQSLALGLQQQYKATAMYSDGTSQDVTSTATWTSSQTSVAAITSGGLATTKATGTSTITATSGSIFGTAVTTTNATLTTNTVTPANPGIALGTSQQFTATGQFSDGSSLNLTRQVTWTSSDVGIAVINASGLANSVASSPTPTTITATLNGISGSTQLTVH